MDEIKSKFLGDLVYTGRKIYGDSDDERLDAFVRGAIHSLQLMGMFQMGLAEEIIKDAVTETENSKPQGSKN